MRVSRLVLTLAATSVLVGCGSSTSSGEGDRLLVATTVSPLTSIASAVAGDRADVEGIVPEGTNSHTFEPAPQVAALLSRADVVLVNGLQLEEPTKDLAEANLKEGATVVELADEVLPESEWIYDFSFPEEDGKPNPHVWTDPLYADDYARVIADALATADPDNGDYYRANAQAFAQQAQQLADAVRADQRSVPDGGLTLLTYHDAYAYFARDFGWTVIGAVQPKNFEDPTPQEVAALIDQVRARNVSTIFGSEVFPSAVLEEIGRATGARYEDTLRDDDLPGAPGDPEHSWQGLMVYDFRTMIAGLGGTTDHLDALTVEPVSPDDAEYPQ